VLQEEKPAVREGFISSQRRSHIVFIGIGFGCDGESGGGAHLISAGVFLKRGRKRGKHINSDAGCFENRLTRTVKWACLFEYPICRKCVAEEERRGAGRFILLSPLFSDIRLT
jgi:hypothetical protein